MIFIGDIACPYNKVDEFVSAVRKVDLFKDEIIILNLEANILTKAETKRPLTLYNAPSVLDGFSDARKVIVSLANNHMYESTTKSHFFCQNYLLNINELQRENRIK